MPYVRLMKLSAISSKDLDALSVEQVSHIVFDIPPTEDRPAVKHAGHLKSCGKVDHFHYCCHIIKKPAAFLLILKSKDCSVELLHVFLLFISDHDLPAFPYGHLLH